MNKDVKGKEPTAENPVSQINKDKERSGELDIYLETCSLAELSAWNLPLELSKSVEKSQTAQACVLTTRSRATTWCNAWSWVLSEADLLSMHQAEF